MTSTRKVTLKDMRKLLLVRDRVIWYPDLNTDTMACPIGVRINRVPLYMKFFKVTFRPSKCLKFIGRWFQRAPQTFIPCCQEKIMGHYAVFMCRLLGSLSNDDGDGNENGKKAIALDSKNKNCAHASHFFAYFVAVVARLRRESA